MSNYLTCPVRGKLNKKEKGAFSEFSEEYQRIECVRFLLNKGYPKKNFDFEREIIKYGSSGRNSLRADIIVYNVDKSNINTNEEKIHNIILVAEVKKKSKDKEAEAMRTVCGPLKYHYHINVIHSTCYTIVLYCLPMWLITTI